ncbi:MAG: hypothetical protein VW547_04620 [Alphaproteobacteria bacterium]|jgi:hypothetical protein
MKFLLFNVVVVGALIFLIAGERADLAKSVGTAVAALMDRTPDVANAADPVPVAPRKPEVSTAVSAEKKLKTKAAAPEKIYGAAAEPVPVTAPKPIAPAAVPAEEKRKTKAAARENISSAAAEPVPESANRRTASAAPPSALELPRDVAERRKEVLGGLLPNEIGTEKIIEVDPSKFMSADQRRRDLILLSEEMELFSADTLGR